MRKGIARQGHIRRYGMMEFHEKLQKLLDDRNLSQEITGKMVGYSQGLVSRWCRGKNTPDIFQGRDLARLLGVSLDYLVDDSLDDPPEPEFTHDERHIIEVIRAMGLNKMRILRLLIGADSISSPELDESD
jgi:transcriptional regulator with XRE-family HTH domain